MSKLISTLILSAFIAFGASSVMASGGVSGTVYTTVDTGDISQIAHDEGENLIEMGNVKEDADVSGYVDTYVHTDDIYQHADDHGENKIKMGNVGE